MNLPDFFFDYMMLVISSWQYCLRRYQHKEFESIVSVKVTILIPRHVRDFCKGNTQSKYGDNKGNKLEGCLLGFLTMKTHPYIHF